MEDKTRSLAEEVLNGPIPNPDLLTEEEVSDLIPVAEFLKKWSSSFLEQVLSRALKGSKIPGYKLVEGKSSRTWKNPDEALRVLIKAGYEKSVLQTSPELVSVSEAEKIVGGKKKFEEFLDLVAKTTGKPTLVAASDKRPEYRASSAQDDFQDLIGKETK